jgi:hypothetical protein
MMIDLQGYRLYMDSPAVADKSRMDYMRVGYRGNKRWHEVVKNELQKGRV